MIEHHRDSGFEWSNRRGESLEALSREVGAAVAECVVRDTTTWASRTDWEPPPDSVRKGTVVQWRSGPAGDPPAVDQPRRASHHQAIHTGRLSTAA